jgi:phosphoribosyl 1,2-cyclic phosphate phosphodiesterase
MGLWDLSHIYNRKQKINLTVPAEILKNLRKIPSFLLIQFKIKVVQPGEKFELSDNLKGVYFPVEHGRIPAFGIKIIDKYSLVYIPDMARLPKTSIGMVKNTDILAMDGSSLSKQGQAHSHQSMKEGVSLAKNLGVKQTYFIHIGHITGIHDELVRFVREKGGSDFLIPYDGLEITL